MSNKIFKNNELSYICAELSMMFKSGVGPQEGLELCLENQTGEKAEMLKKTIALMQEGEMFSEALKDAGFPQLMYSMVAAGETTGRLDEVLSALSACYDRLDSAKSALSSAILYPSMIFIFMLTVQGVLCAKVLPVMADALAQSGGRLHGAALFFAGIGAEISAHPLSSFAVLAAIAGIVIFCLCNMEKIFNMFLRSTGWGRESEKAFSVTAFSMAMKAGLDPCSALEMIIPLSKDSQPFEKCLDMLKEGESLGTAMESSSLAEAHTARLIDIGVMSGSADSVIDGIAKKLTQGASDRLDKSLSAVEPALTATMALMTGIILLSVMSPLTSLISAV